MERRKVTFKLYPNAHEAERLTAWVRLHCELYNAALQERIEAYRKAGTSISYYDQQNVLPEIKAARPEFVELGSHALQQTLRREFVHQKTAGLVRTCAVIATEELAPKNMSRSARGTVDTPGRRVRQKAGLNREILSAAFGMAHQMLSYKVVETGTRLHLSDTRQLKPSQRCSGCWEIVPKTLAQRLHVCPHCGLTLPRDQNSASVVLIDAHTPGTGVAARPKPLARQRAKSKSVTRETPATTPQDV